MLWFSRFWVFSRVLVVSKFLVFSKLLVSRKFFVYRKFLWYSQFLGVRGAVVLLGTMGSMVQAQYALEFATISGKMLAHSVYNTNLNGRRSLGLQATAIWLLPSDTGGLISRSQKHRYVGVSLLSMDMGDGLMNTIVNDPKAVVPMGSGHGAMAVSGARLVMPPVLGFNALQMQWGFGLLYLTKFYDSVSNPLNLAMSSALNFAAQLKVQAVRHISPQSTVSVGIEMFHTSNSNWQKPNVGLNYAQLSLGWVHRFHPGKHLDKDPCFWKGESIKQLSVPYQISTRYAYRKYRRDFPVYYSVFIAEGSWGLPNSYRLTELRSNPKDAKLDETELATSKQGMIPQKLGIGMPRGEWRFGVNVFYETAAVGKDAGGRVFSLDSRLELGAFARRVMRFGPLDVFLDFGVYLVPPQSDRIIDLEKTQWFYNAIGTQYRINNHWLLIHRLKAHYHVADYMELGLLYQF